MSEEPLNDDPIVAHDLACVVINLFERVVGTLGEPEIKLEPGWDAIGTGKEVFLYNNDDGSAILTTNKREDVAADSD